jgi:hypothetical protein
VLVALKKHFSDVFASQHMAVMPVPYGSVKKLVMGGLDSKDSKDQLKSALKEASYSNETNLCSNLCLAKGCPFYGRLVPKEHFQTWSKRLPWAFHLSVKEGVESGKSNAEIVKMVLERNSDQSRRKDGLLGKTTKRGTGKLDIGKHFESSRKEMLAYIAELRKAYEKIMAKE